MRKLIYMALGILVCLLFGCAADEVGRPTVSVMLAESDGFSVAENPIHVAPGEDAVFHVELEEDFLCIQASPEAVWDAENSTLTLSNVRYPATLWLRAAKNPEQVRYYIVRSGTGIMTTDTDQGLVYTGTTVTVSAKPSENFVFDGWSLGKALRDGGALLTERSKLTYTVQEATTLYANFSSLLPEASLPASEETLLVLYDANGGTHSSGQTIHTEEMPRVHIYQNSLPDQGHFCREGYQLLGYNTRRDGSGEFITPGAKIVPERENDAVLLYCMWAKENPESDFTWEESDGSAVLIGYTGSSDTLVIPDTLGGLPVTTVKAGAVKGDFTTLVLPEPIRVVEDGAFVTTASLETIYLRDNVSKIKDKAFTDLSGWQNLYLIAAHNPAYTHSDEGNFAVKWERLVQAKKAGEKVLVVVSGSSSYYGLSTEQLETLLENEYTVVNYGTNAGAPSVAYLEMISHYVGEGDIVIHAPEVRDVPMGSNVLNSRLLINTEYYYNIYAMLDMRNYTGFFSGLAEFNSYRNNSKKTYTMTNSTINALGEHKNTDKLNSDDYHNGSTITFPTGKISGLRQTCLNRVYQTVLDTGARVYMSCAPCNRNAVVKAYLADYIMDAYMKSIRESVIVPVISHVKDYVLASKYIYNTDWHPNKAGREIRTQQLYTDLTAQWEKEAQQP